MRVGRCNSRSVDSPLFRFLAVDIDRGVVEVAGRGDLGAHTGPELRGTIAPVLPSDSRRVCVDRGLVSSVYSSGMAVLADSYKRALAQGCELWLCPQARRCAECWTGRAKSIPIESRRGGSAPVRTRGGETSGSRRRAVVHVRGAG
jgi:anti-anti-sigma factor